MSFLVPDPAPCNNYCSSRKSSRNDAESSRIFPDCGFLMDPETESETDRRNTTETMVSPNWLLASKMDTQAVWEENVICSFPFLTFLLPVNTWTGLG